MSSLHFFFFFEFIPEALPETLGCFEGIGFSEKSGSSGGANELNGTGVVVFDARVGRRAFEKGLSNVGVIRVGAEGMVTSRVC
jgi:hypothetical protein